MGMEAMMMVMTGCGASGENYCQRTCRPHHCPGSSQDRHGWGIEVILHCFTLLLGQKDCFLGRSSSVWRRKHGKGSCLALPIIRGFFVSFLIPFVTDIVAVVLIIIAIVLMSLLFSANSLISTCYLVVILTGEYHS